MNAGERRASVEEKLRELCTRVAMDHGLPRDQAEELYGHMEDKALAYMSGDESLSVDDVVLLVREHFGSAEVLGEMLGENHRRRGLVGLLASGWPKRRSTDFWGIFHFPWIGENKLLFPVVVLLGVDAIGYLLLAFLAYGNRHGWSRGGGGPVPSWAYVAVPFVALAASLLSSASYWVVNTRLRSKRASLRRNVDLESDGIVLRGMLESPGIIQVYEKQLTLVPMVGEQTSFPLAAVKSCQQKRFFNGTRYLGDNAGFILDVEGHQERIGFVVPRPAKWRCLPGLGEGHVRAVSEGQGTVSG